MKHTRPTITAILRRIRTLEEENHGFALKLFSGDLSPSQSELYNRLWHDNTCIINELQTLIGEIDNG